MSQDKNTILEKINQVEGFDPKEYAVEYTDLSSGETRKRLPVQIQIAWFRLKNPEGRISVQVAPGKDCFVATARVYANYKDPVEAFLAEATASRGPSPDKPSVSPREWAQTAAIGIALRNAGYGLQFAIAGEDFAEEAPNELESIPGRPAATTPSSEEEEYEVTETPQTEMTVEEKVQKAMQVPCPIAKYNGRTLGEVLAMDPKAINWVATKYTGSEDIAKAAKLICDYAVSQTPA